MISSPQSTPTLAGDSPGISSAIAMSAAQDTSFPDFTTLAENDCAACKKRYTILCMSDDFFCDDCMSILQGNEPKTDKEIELENVVRNFSDDDIRAVGLGRFFELEEPASAAPPQPTTTVPPARPLSNSHEAQNSAVRSQILHQRNISGNNIPNPTLSNMLPSASPMLPSQPQIQKAPSSNDIFTLEEPATAAPLQPTTTVPPSRQPSSSREAQMSALRSQMAHQRSISGSNSPNPLPSTKAPSASPKLPSESQVRTKVPPPRQLSSREAQMSALNSQLMHQRKTSGNNFPRVPQSSEAPSASPMPSFLPQIRDNPPTNGMTGFPTGPVVTQDFLRQWAFTHHSEGTIPTTKAGHSRSTSTPIPQSGMESPGEIFGSPSVQAQARKKGKRMICATCNKDSPVDRKKNDGVNCTRCYQKLMKSAAASSALPEMSGGKRSYEGAFDGYSPADGSPFKRLK
ncbi:hypothetical protein PRZ48_014030 [Zasmidium cellare]|uniref:Uncharacterized protein n=1 Tax=Zasmidium cellare TaxID=395010 RepID=A0ABR0DZU5_ZASCE|nr:hypothetical protein PRZ48_014030 [Zasmidium cellare]